MYMLNSYISVWYAASCVCWLCLSYTKHIFRATDTSMCIMYIPLNNLYNLNNKRMHPLIVLFFYMFFFIIHLLGSATCDGNNHTSWTEYRWSCWPYHVYKSAVRIYIFQLIKNYSEITPAVLYTSANSNAI